ncbi:MAG: hypothetical protein PHP59_12080 [Methanofollis sp.]|uniref:hypothetical protein n=1 Tax=Methanofollis sp. TaxID=2052835 RepID=UPI002607D9F2|nr:hypothetical protein [Methanofollis sp.]MDD4256097.1 hypothetical protein [Methanofollis sp.]
MDVGRVSGANVKETPPPLRRYGRLQDHTRKRTTMSTARTNPVMQVNFQSCSFRGKIERRGEYAGEAGQ